MSTRRASPGRPARPGPRARIGRRRGVARVVVALLATLAAAALTDGEPSALAGPAAVAAAAAAASDAATVLRLVHEWRIEEAAALVARLVAARPDAPEVLFLDGRVRFEQGDYKGAVTRMDDALERVPPAAAREWQALRDLAAATEEATRGFSEQRSPDGHFIVRYAGKDELLLPYAFEALEGARRAIAEHDFSATALLGEPVRVEIYPEVADLARVSTLTLKEIETSGTIALCKFNRLMIVSPRALVHGYPWLDTLAHEYTHYVVSRASRDTVPIWFHEGLAKFEERRWRAGPGSGLTPTMEHLLATALAHSRRLITFDEMYPSMAKLPSQADTALAFAEVYTVVEYLHARRGWDGVRAVIERMKAGRGDARAVAEVTGQTFDEFQRDWKAWLRGKKLREHPGLVPASLKFVKLAGESTDRAGGGGRGGGSGGGRGKKGAGSDGRGDDDDTSDIAEARARKLARIAGMLRARERLSAAVVEYEKAQAIVGPSSLPVAQKLGKTCLELGQLDRAIAATAPAYELYPDASGLAATLGEAWLRRGDSARAAPFLEAAVRVSPFDPAPHCGLARAFAAGHDPRAAREQKACAALGGPAPPPDAGE